MSGQVEISPELVIKLFEQYVASAGIAEAGDWHAALRHARTVALTGDPASKSYWVNLYRTRLERAASRGDAGMAADLARVVGELSVFDSDTFHLIVIVYTGYGYLIWLDGHLSFIVSCLRGRDRRARS
jgi:hypothetical protein